MPVSMFDLVRPPYEQEAIDPDMDSSLATLVGREFANMGLDGRNATADFEFCEWEIADNVTVFECQGFVHLDGEWDQTHISLLKAQIAERIPLLFEPQPDTVTSTHNTTPTPNVLATSITATFTHQEDSTPDDTPQQGPYQAIIT